MLTSLAVGKLWTIGEPNSFLKASLGGISQVSTKGCNVPFQNSLESHHVHKLHTCSPFRIPACGLRSQHLWGDCKQEIPRSLLCHLHVSASSDEDYRSSRNIAISLFKRYRNVIDRGGGDNLKEFINAGVNAYALGCTDEGLRKELLDMKNSGTEVEGMETYGGGTSLRFRILSDEVHECILWLSIVFITILCTPQPTVVRWSSIPPVSTDIMLQWKGFCALIANAYYTRGMAWLPVKTLQLEQMAVMGSAEEPSVVASRMRLVFSTLEVVSPQWPRV
ncbi:uncharacterized protein A4U43_C08F19260 [Asparagus officinalis]|uniref:uncharacterized protein LOC109820518 n=1 Tax=Asparagus officinalis TaxID=4686 RepID=UPI00098DE706|nr:uncharacterized protein LOC109820518 [Asparagus officinalis]XP_020242263.1 uncharacterized protein LOC109820518 [Asparagus officinalis]XP_020242264.1 uncharacterized protein LOC109820518 [Asparagus officinalis]ONK60511.1 uncharacterized protein A4U43_C08F19260 [Asparagus officinalis]